MKKGNNYTSTFEEALYNTGYLIKGAIVADEEIHRFGKDKNCWYICGPDWGIADDWSSQLERVQWFANKRQKLNPAKMAEIEAKIEATRKEREVEQEEAAKEAEQRLAQSQPTGSSKYLNSKKVGAHGTHFDSHENRPCAIIPVRDIDGKLWTIQRIYDDHRKYFLANSRKSGCFHIIGEIKQNEPIVFVEGYATGATVYEATGLAVVVCFDAGNLGPAIKAFRQKYPEAKLIIAGDNDAFKEYNTGKLKAEEAAGRYSCTVVLPEFSESSQQHKPTDFNDLMIHEGMEVVKAQISKALKRDTVVLPSGFMLGKGGLWYQGDGEKAISQWICSSIEVVAYTRDMNSENWGRLVRFKDSDNHVHERAIPMELLSGDCTELYAMLLSLGLRLSSIRGARARLPELLQTILLNKRAICTTSIGWYGDYFVMPDGAIPKTDTIYLQSDNSNFVGFRSSGTLEEWKENVALPCRDNSRLVFSLCCAFAAPLLPILNAESGGFNLKGASSIGKSTALAVAASAVGSPKYIQQWKSTSNGIEGTAEAHNHLLLCLDEIGLVDGKEAGEIIYMLANGSGKSRMKAAGGLRKKLEWELLFLSTGEVSISDKLNEVGKKAQAGMVTRIVDIPADAGKGYKLFDTIHDFKDGGYLARHLKDTVSKYYGTAIRAYLAQLANIKPLLPEAYGNIQADFFSRYVNNAADPQVKRVASRFAIVVAAGQLAVKLGILPYAIEEVFEAVGTCFNAWLEDRGSDVDHESEVILTQVKAFFEANHSSRFALTKGKFEGSNMESEKILNQAGYKIINSKGSYDFYVNPTTFKMEICKGEDEKRAKKLLRSKGLLIGDKAGGYTKSVNIRELKGNARVIHITSAILVEDQ